MINDFAAGAGYLFKGFGYLNTKGLRRYIWVPTLISLVVYLVLLVVFYYQFGSLMDYLLPDANAVSDWPSWIRWAGEALLYVLRILLWAVFFLAYALAMFYSFTILANIIGSPFNGILAAKLEALLTGNSLPDEPLTLAMISKEAKHAVSHEIKKTLYFLLFAIPLLLLFLVPVINIAASFIWMVFTAWMAALQYIDYPADNYKIGFKAMREQLKTKRSLALGFGGATMLLMLIPFLNLITMPVAVIGATILWVEKLETPSQSLNDTAEPNHISHNPDN